jgi:hypothetical protein
VPTKELWFLPTSGPGRHYILDYEPCERDGAGKALALRMYRKFAAGEVSAEPVFAIVLAFTTLTLSQLSRTYGATSGDLDAFLLKTAERAASCLDMRLPPPLEPEVPKGLVIWLSAGDYASERALTHTLVTAVG